MVVVGVDGAGTRSDVRAGLAVVSEDGAGTRSSVCAGLTVVGEGGGELVGVGPGLGSIPSCVKSLTHPPSLLSLSTSTLSDLLCESVVSLTHASLFSPLSLSPTHLSCNCCLTGDLISSRVAVMRAWLAVSCVDVVCVVCVSSVS